MELDVIRTVIREMQFKVKTDTLSELDQRNYIVIIEALEKQIPKNTQETQELMTIEYICPVCHCTSARHFNYCWNCGQAISNN